MKRIRDALHRHASLGNLLQVQSLVDGGVDPDEMDSYGETPLMAAARNSRREVFEFLMNVGADIHCYDHNDWTALHYASRAGWVEIVQSLVRNGVTIDMRNSGGQTPLMLAARHSRREIFELLVNADADIRCYDDYGWTALHHASRAGSVEIVQSLVKNVQSLVKNGVRINMRNSGGETPLMLAARHSHREVFELLINSGEDVHCWDYRGRTVLHHASCSPGSVEIVQALVNKGVAIDTKNSKGETPLHYAIQMYRREIVVWLLNAGADCNLEDNKGESPFSLLVRKLKHIETIKLFIEKGAFVNSTDYNTFLKDPFLKRAILRDVKLCSQAVINKFNNKDLPLFYKELASAQKLPQIDKMKIRNGSGMALEVERAVDREIQAKGFCNIFQMVPLVLGMLCVKASLQKAAFDRTSRSESRNGLKRSGYPDKQEYPCKKMCN